MELITIANLAERASAEKRRTELRCEIIARIERMNRNALAGDIIEVRALSAHMAALCRDWSTINEALEANNAALRKADGNEPTDP